MTAKAYNDFTDIHGNRYGFADYMSFATWFYSVPYRVAVRSFSAETFKRLNYAAGKSKEARTPAIK